MDQLSSKLLLTSSPNIDNFADLYFTSNAVKAWWCIYCI